MGYRMVKFNVTPEENEQIHAVIKVPEETRSVFHGIVIDKCNKPIKNAVLKLLIMDCNKNHLEPVTHTFTDENGEFLFGPLCANVKYVIKVWTNHVKTREIVIVPDECDEECLHSSPPCDDHRPPFDDYTQSYDEHRAPFDDYRPPCDEHRQPCGDNRSSCDEHRQPCDDHRQPCDDHRSSCDDNRQSYVRPNINNNVYGNIKVRPRAIINVGENSSQ